MAEISPAAAHASAFLEVERITKRFGGLTALSEVSFSIAKGEIYGLIGPNGAGKTTLFNVLTGIYRQDEGRFRFQGAQLKDATPDRIARLGIARTFQNIRLFNNLSALENVMIGRHVRTRAGVFGAILRGRGTGAEERAIEKRAHELLEYVGIGQRGNELAKHLSYGDQRRLEIARALATEPRLLALDEPAAGMNATEKVELRKLLEAIRKDGVTILIIEHDVRLVMGLCDRVLVLDYGRNIAEGLPLVPEGRGVFAQLTIEENLAMGAYARSDKAAVAADMERAYALFPRLKERRRQTAGTLSGGEQQMLAIARALMGRPKLLLLDEPSMGLAPLMVEKIFELIRAIAAEGVTLLLVEQNARLAPEVSHRGYVLEGGVVAISAETRALLGDPRIREAYLGE